MPRFVYLFSVVLCFYLCATSLAHAQFNAPSLDIMSPGHLNITATQYLRLWHTSSGPTELFALGGVYGIGHNMEIGLNVGPFNYHNIGDSALFMDATLKWRPWRTTINIGSAAHTLGLVLADTMGIGIHGDATGNIRNFIYAAGYLTFDTTQTRISTGVYHATRNVFDTHDRVGAQLTFEQPISLVPGLTLAADWYSGNSGSLTTGFLWGKNNFNVSIGYSLSNNGRKNDLIMLSTAFKF